MDARQVWQATLERVKLRVSPAAFSTWFKGTSGAELEGRRLTVATPSAFACEHLAQRFAEIARIAVSETLGQSAELVFVVRPRSTDEPQEDATTPARPTPARPTPARPTPARPTTRRATQRAADESAARPASQTRRASRTRAESAPQPRPARSQSVAAPRAPHPQPPVTPPLAGGARPPHRAARSHARAAELGLTQEPLLVERVKPIPPSIPASQAVQSARAVQPTARAASVAPSFAAAPVLARTPRVSEPLAPGELHARHTFDSFVVGESNLLAQAAAQEVSSAPGARYNPLFIYGPTGLGKTHLLHAIGHRARAQGLRVAYVTAERFTNEIIEAIRQRSTNAFRARYRGVDVLLMDDVQFIVGKESTEEELFHTFNTLHENNSQIVLTSDRLPSAMSALHDRLRSRFAWGLMADIHAPDFDHRVEILRAKATALRATMSDEALACLASVEWESVRAMEGGLTRAVAQARMLGQPLDVELVTQTLKALAAEQMRAPGSPPRPATSAEVLAAVGQRFGVSVEALRGKTREHAIAWARQVAMYLLREETSASLHQIGGLLGGRDHTTVLHGCGRVSETLPTDERLRTDVAAIRATLRA